ncbi:MAG TPA: response regulator transcription factor [Bryobacteraceae bacterium]|nr:response regulator transcription factor [Bryobacteraceae bacterium]
MIRLLIAAPSAIVRAGLESVGAQGAGIQVVGASGLAGLSAAVDRYQPDVLLAAVEAHHDEPPEDLIALAARDGAPAIVVLAPDLQSTWTGDALRSGIRAVLPGDLGAREILAAVEAAAAGLVVLHPQDITALVADRPLLPAAQLQTLTPREIQVLAMLAEGHGNKTIAWKLGISEHTAKFHVASILSKLNAGTRTEAVTLGIRRGLILI